MFFVLIRIIMEGHFGNWVHDVFTLVFCGITCLIYIIDNANYLYVVEDDHDEEDE